LFEYAHGTLARRNVAISAHSPLPIAGTQFAHALCAVRSTSALVRLLSVKGDSALFYGLRPPRTTADADVLVEPSRAKSFAEALALCGWGPRPASESASAVVTHSVALIHPDWPCDIDVHWTFPGFLGDPGYVFDVLWERRQTMTQAGVEVFIPDRAGAVLISALHSLRTPVQTPRHAEEFRMLVNVCAELSEAERRDIVDLAIQTTAVDTARPFLETLGVPLPDPTPSGVNPALDEWRARVAADGVVGAQALIAARRLAWYRRPAAMWHIIWPSERDFRIDHPEVAPGRGPLLRARFARFGRGIRQIPAILRGRRQARRGITETSMLDGDS